MRGIQNLSVALQAQSMKTKWPIFRVHSWKSNKIVWRGTIKPTSISEIYEVEISFRHCERPVIRILSPKLELAEGARRLPHVYKGDLLCLYYPRFQEWTSSKQLADTIVPWTSLWLFYYEVWVATGEWRGGGKHPARGPNNG